MRERRREIRSQEEVVGQQGEEEGGGRGMRMMMMILLMMRMRMRMMEMGWVGMVERALWRMTSIRGV
mgnify:CR=1 FL=1